MNAPIEFRRGVFYPFAWIEERLAGVMSLQTFLQNLSLDCTGKNRQFQNGLWGDEILKAIEHTTLTDKPAQTPNMEVSEPFGKRKRGRPRKQPANVQEIR